MQAEAGKGRIMTFDVTQDVSELWSELTYFCILDNTSKQASYLAALLLLANVLVETCRYFISVDYIHD